MEKIEPKNDTVLLTLEEIKEKLEESIGTEQVGEIFDFIKEKFNIHMSESYLEGFNLGHSVAKKARQSKHFGKKVNKKASNKVE